MCAAAPFVVCRVVRLTLAFGFRAHVERRRDEMGSPEWEALYGAAWREITHAILPQFDQRTVAEAETIARGLDMHLPPEMLQ